MSGDASLPVTSTHSASGDPLFFSGKQAVARADHYARLRKRLQQKGTELFQAQTAPDRAARETVESCNQPYHFHVHHPQAPGVPHRAGRANRHSRAHQAEEAPAQKARQRQRAGLCQTAQGKPAALPMVLCRAASHACLQSGALRLDGHQSRCRLQQPGLPQVRAHRAGQSAREGPCVCLSALPLHAPCGSGGGEESGAANASGSARPGQNGAVVGSPRYVGQRSQSGTPLEVCRVAVEPRRKPLTSAMGSLTYSCPD